MEYLYRVKAIIYSFLQLQMQAIASLYEELSQQHEMYNGEPAFMHVCKFKKALLL